MNKLSEIIECFYVDSNFVSFSAAVHIKVKSLGLELRVYGMIVKDNVNDYLLLNHRGIIEGLGQKLTREGVFSKQDIKRPIEDIIKIDLISEMKDQRTARKRIIIKSSLNKSNNSVATSSAG